LVLPLAAFFRLFFFAFFAAVLGAAFFFADFLGVLPFRTCFFVGFAFRPAVFFDLVDFLLVFFLVAIRAV
jgi:hypothetical protein